MITQGPDPALQESELAAIPPKERQFVLLSGLGFYRLNKQRQKMLRYIFLGSVAAHVLGMVIFGGWVIMKHLTEKVTIFEAAPKIRKYEPRKLEHKVKLMKRQRSSSRPSMIPRIVSTKMAKLSLPDIKMDPKLVHTSFQPKFKAVTGMGLGAGLGTGYGTDGFGEGVSSYNFFGIPGRGEKIAILVDVSISMIEKEKGGIEGYMRVKNRLNEVVDALHEGTMFNVIVFADAASAFNPKEMVIASKDNKTKAKLFLRPFNTEGNYGLTEGNVQMPPVGKKAHGGTTRLDLALNVAFMQEADTILIISDGIPRVKKAWSAEQMQAFQQQQAQWYAQNAAAIAAFDAAYNAAPVVTERVWVPPTPEIPPPKDFELREGQPPPRGQPAQPGRWVVVTRRGGRTGWHRPAPPPIPEPGWWTLADFIEHLTILYEHYYSKKGKKPPVIHCIGYMIDQDGHAFLQGLAQHYKGQYRRVARLR
ncbi:MAG: hypothetical protein ACUVWX_04460, partial [Kiritimatiellia bacterium]